jgi:hypothetical protein
VLVDLKVGKLAHQDVGQMDLYVRVFDEQHRQEGDNPTLGLILCSERNTAVAKYSLLADKAQLFASKYQAVMPTEAELQAELERDRALLEMNKEWTKDILRSNGINAFHRLSPEETLLRKQDIMHLLMKKIMRN